MYTRREIFLGVLKYTAYGLGFGLLPNVLLLAAWATGGYLTLSDDIFKVSGLFLGVCLVYMTIVGISLRPRDTGHQYVVGSSSYKSSSAAYVSSDSYVAANSSSASCSSSPDCSGMGDSGCSVSSCD